MLSRRIVASTSGLISQVGLRHKYVASQYEDNSNSDAPKSTPSSSSSNTTSNNASSSSNAASQNGGGAASSSANANSSNNKASQQKPATAEEDKRTPEQIKEDFIEELIKRDKELFELKRQHELSMLRVQQHQNRILQDQHDRGIYYENSVNVHTFETITVGQYTQRNTLHHVTGLQKLRSFKIQVAIATTVYIWAFLVYRYVVNPDMTYVEAGMKKMGDSSALRQHYREEEQKREFERYANSDGDDDVPAAASKN